MTSLVYFDTSALAKWYVNEAGSDDVERFIRRRGPVTISDLTVVEMRCLLARRRREKNLSERMEAEIFAAFEEDIRRSFLIRHTFPVDLASGAVNLMARLADIPVRTLDALHLMIAKEIPVETLATADNIMADGAKALGLKVVFFGSRG